MAGRATSERTRTTRAAVSPTDIRNVVLVGPSGSGKTTLVEALLAHTGTIPRAGSVTEGTTVGDHDPAAVRQQRSVALSVASLLHDVFNGLARRQVRFLLQVAHAVALGESHLSGVVRVDAGDDPEKRTLPGTVQPEHADLCPVEEREVDVFQDLALGRVDSPDTNE